MKDLIVDEQGEKSPIYGDLLEVVLSNVPLIDLASVCRVSKSWCYSVLSSLSHLKKIKAWVIIHTESTSSLSRRMTHAYDPRSNTWIEIKSPLDCFETSSFCFSGSSTLVYKLSGKELVFSSDSLHQVWSRISPPTVCRVRPIVALVGRHLVVAGGTMAFEEDPLSVEMYDMDTSKWSTCQSIPDILKNSSSSTWLSVASNQTNLYVTQKHSGLTYLFSPLTKTWSGPYDVSPDPHVFFSAIAFAGDDLILAGLIGHAQNVKSLKLWKIKPELAEFNEIGEIPVELLDGLIGESWHSSSISLLASNDFISIYKNSDAKVIIYCEYVEGVWKWGSVKNMVWDETRINHRMIMSCTKVGISDLQRAMKFRKCQFLEKTYN